MHYCLTHQRAWVPETLGGPGRLKHPAHWAPWPAWRVEWVRLFAEAWGCAGAITMDLEACDRCAATREAQCA